jgi:hypothetical protein
VTSQPQRVPEQFHGGGNMPGLDQLANAAGRYLRRPVGHQFHNLQRNSASGTHPGKFADIAAAIPAEPKIGTLDQPP